MHVSDDMAKFICAQTPTDGKQMMVAFPNMQIMQSKLMVMVDPKMKFGSPPRSEDHKFRTGVPVLF